MKLLGFFLAFLLTSICWANDTNSNFALAEITANAKNVIHVKNVVRGDRALDLDLVTTSSAFPQTFRETNVKVNACFAKAPSEQWPNKRHGNINYPKPPVGFTGGIAWVNAVNNGPNAGYVLIRKLSLNSIDAYGKISVIDDNLVCRDCDSENHVFGYSLPRNQWRDPSAWSKPNQSSIYQVLSYSDAIHGVIKIPTATKPFDVFHLWSTHWPRATVNQSVRYFVEAEVLPVKAGMIQIGWDYWTDDGKTSRPPTHIGFARIKTSVGKPFAWVFNKNVFGLGHFLMV